MFDDVSSSCLAKRSRIPYLLWKQSRYTRAGLFVLVCFVPVILAIAVGKPDSFLPEWQRTVLL